MRGRRRRASAAALLLLAGVVGLMTVGVRPVEGYTDFLNVFCGTKNCYDVLGVSSQATRTEIKRAYRQLSLKWHPDKNKEDGAVERFREIAKAAEVLTDAETRGNYDDYLRHPDAYFSLSARVAMRKADVRYVTAGILGVLSVIQYLSQFYLHRNALGRLRRCVIVGKGPKVATDLHETAKQQYLDMLRDEAQGGGGAKKRKQRQSGRAEPKYLEMLRDRRFVDIVDGLLGNYETFEISGGMGKPKLSNLVGIWVVLLPFRLAYNAWFQVSWWYRHSIQDQELTRGDMEHLVIKQIGRSLWDSLEDAKRDELIERRIWEKDQHEQHNHSRRAARRPPRR